MDPMLERNINLDLQVARDHLDSLSQPSNSNTNALEKKINKLSLLCWSMWTLIMESADLTEQDLMQRVKDLDQLDGKADGQVSRPISKCTKCDRVLSEQHSRCLYCGAERVYNSAFDAVI